MSSGMRMTLAQLRPELREQAEKQLQPRLVQPMGPKDEGHRFKPGERRFVHRKAVSRARAAPLDTLLWTASALGLEKPELEVKFHPTRLWRFDAAWPAQRVAVEIEGVTHGSGRHQRPRGYAEDCRKYNAAALLGWRVLRFTQDMIRRGEAAGVLERAFKT